MQGAFEPFIDRETRLIAVEGAGAGALGQGASALLMYTGGQVAPTRSIAAGLDYPAVSPMLARLARDGRVELATATDEEALEGYRILARAEGVLPTLESAHAVAYLLRRELPRDARIVVNISGRGDKDMETVGC